MGGRVPNVPRERTTPREAARIAIDLAGLHVSVHGHMAAGSGWVERARMLLERVGPLRRVGLPGTGRRWRVSEPTSTICWRAPTARSRSPWSSVTSTSRRTRWPTSVWRLVTRGAYQRGSRATRRGAGGDLGRRGEPDRPPASASARCSLRATARATSDVLKSGPGSSPTMIRGLGDRPTVLHTHCRLAYGSVLRAAGRWPEAEALDARGARSGRGTDIGRTGPSHRSPRRVARGAGSDRGGRRAPRTVRGPCHAAVCRWRRCISGAVHPTLPSPYCSAG